MGVVFLGRKVTEKTLFGIGSITKSFTATLTALLIGESEGKITFDTPISELLGEEYTFPDETRKREVTIKDILSHRTGLAHVTPLFLFGAPPGISREEYSKKGSFLPETKSFRDEWVYNNFMYMLVAHLSEKVWGTAWEDNLKARLLDKIGMTSTEAMTKEDELLGDRYARPYVYMKGKLTEGSPKPYILNQIGPVGSLASNGEDMIKFMRFILNKGKLEDGTQLISETMFEEMWNPVIPLNRFMRFFTQKLSPHWPVAEISLGCGLGWFLNVYRGYRSVGHEGGIHSYSSVMEVFPDLDMGLFMAINGPTLTPARFPSTSVQATVYFLKDILLGKTPWIDSEHACSFPKPWFDLAAMMPPATERTPAKPEFSLAEYTGSYFNPLMGELVISVDTSSDGLRIKLNALDGDIVPEEGDLFSIVIRGDLEFLTFEGRDNPFFNYKVKFTRGAYSFDSVEILSIPQLEPSLVFVAQYNNDPDNKKTEL